MTFKEQDEEEELILIKYAVNGRIPWSYEITSGDIKYLIEE